jgi:hypothetical protein
LKEHITSLYSPAALSPAIVLRGLPIAIAGPLPPITSTFLDQLPSSSLATLRVALGIQAGLAGLAGQQYTFEAERGGNLFHIVSPRKGVPLELQASVGAGQINWHTEDPIPPIRLYQPHALSLLCLRDAGCNGRPEERGEERGDVQTLLAALPCIAADLLAMPELITELSKPTFFHPTPDVFALHTRINPTRDAEEGNEEGGNVGGGDSNGVNRGGGDTPTRASLAPVLYVCDNNSYLRQ